MVKDKREGTNGLLRESTAQKRKTGLEYENMVGPGYYEPERQFQIDYNLGKKGYRLVGKPKYYDDNTDFPGPGQYKSNIFEPKGSIKFSRSKRGASMQSKSFRIDNIGPGKYRIDDFFRNKNHQTLKKTPENGKIQSKFTTAKRGASFLGTPNYAPCPSTYNVRGKMGSTGGVIFEKHTTLYDLIKNQRAEFPGPATYNISKGIETNKIGPKNKLFGTSKRYSLRTASSSKKPKNSKSKKFEKHQKRGVRGGSVGPGSYNICGTIGNGKGFKYAKPSIVSIFDSEYGNNEVACNLGPGSYDIKHTIPQNQEFEQAKMDAMGLKIKF